MSDSRLEKLYKGQSLDVNEAEQFFTDIFEGKVDPVVLSSLLTALKIKGYAAEEIGGAASAMIKAAVPFKRDHSISVGEIVGTGGDGLKTINISTMAGIVCACLGLHIAKHGNTAVSSKTGASDVLSQLGYDTAAPQDLTLRNLEQEGFAFFFAQVYHPEMRFAGPVRKTLGTSTIFNILGPLTNPARVDYELLGCYDPNLLEVLARALKVSGVRRAIAVNGNGMDEVSVFGHTNYYEVFEDGHIENGIWTKENFGISQEFNQKQLEGGLPEENAQIVRDVLSGKGTDAHSAVVAANAAVLLRAGGKEQNLKLGFEQCYTMLRSGKPYEKLQQVCKISQGQA